MRGVRVIVSGLVLASVANLAVAQLYRWTDEKGRVHITDTPPPASARNIQKKTLPGSDRPAPGAQLPYELAQATKNFPVTLYTSPTCKDPCARARSVLNRRGVPFKEVQVWDEESNAALKQVSGANDVPTLVVGRSVQVGFEQSAFDALLDAARYPKAGAVPARAQAAPAPPEGYVAPSDQPVSAEPVRPQPEAPAATGPYAPRPPR